MENVCIYFVEKLFKVIIDFQYFAKSKHIVFNTNLIVVL